MNHFEEPIIPVELEKAFQEAIEDISINHNKILDDWCKAYMSELYEIKGSIKPGDFTLFEQQAPLGETKWARKYWFEENKKIKNEKAINPDMVNYYQCKLLHSKIPYWDGGYVYNNEERKMVPNIQYICQICQKLKIEKRNENI